MNKVQKKANKASKDYLSLKRFERVCCFVSDGESVLGACKKVGISRQAFFKRLRSDKHLVDTYARAREERGESCLDKIDTILIDLSNGKIEAQDARVMIDAQKWMASKFYPRMYGDKVELGGSVTVNVLPTVIKEGKNMDIKIGNSIDD